MAEPLIVRTDVEARLGYALTGALAAQADARIDDASALVREIAEGNLDAVDAVSDNVPPAVVAVVCSMVQRAIANPNARSGESIDGHQWQAGGQTGVFANRHERRVIRRAAGVFGIKEQTLEGFMPLHHAGTAFEDDLLGSL